MTGGPSGSCAANDVGLTGAEERRRGPWRDDPARDHGIAAGGGAPRGGGPEAAVSYRKRAVTERFLVIVTTHAPRPPQSPLQSRRVPFFTVSVTRVPEGKLAPQAPAVQLTPAGALVTVPAPPVTFTVSV
jgi:hypothetical protein